MNTPLEAFHQLATLCLCQSHVTQAHEIASEWNQALRHTMREYRLPSNRDVQRLQRTIESLQSDLEDEYDAADTLAKESKDKEARLLKETLSWKKKYDSLDHEAKVAQQASAKTISDLRAIVTSQNNSFPRDLAEIAAQRQSLSELRTTKKKLETDVQQSATQLEALRAESIGIRDEVQRLKAKLQQSSTQIEALKAERIGATDEVQLLKARLQQSTMQNQTFQTEMIGTNNKMESLQGDLGNLQAKMNDLKKSNELMTVELTAKDLALRGEKTRVTELMKVISDLKISEVQLKQVMASCWLHRIYNWLTGSRLVL
ncbi:hypothetical protein FHETE_4964 [Fusarium heterosporum]|uniref:Uncharacterized protein n=1 Tax=Fusarium heterosporum TaxID=42747 RepID=A0A8H5TC30_FUSHE|nr:hypothetical protein FHETE_4964 [Fusarium heterosporum]